jgi:hypothetical protein
MKKLRLKALELGAKEVLSRAQLKNVLGGSGSGSGSGSGFGSGGFGDCGDLTHICDGQSPLWHAYLCVAQPGSGCSSVWVCAPSRPTGC